MELDQIIDTIRLYNARKIDIEDIKLKLEEFEIEKCFTTTELKEMSSTYIDYINEEQRATYSNELKRQLNILTIRNKRIDNAMSILSDLEKDIINKLYKDDESITQVANELYMTRKTIRRIRDKAINKIRIN